MYTYLQMSKVVDDNGALDKNKCEYNFYNSLTYGFLSEYEPEQKNNSLLNKYGLVLVLLFISLLF